jgi:SAM-dependent methyltransferase
MTDHSRLEDRACFQRITLNEQILNLKLSWLFGQWNIEGAFFLPHLRTGMRVLDVGCGPGSITLGLAEAVAPGEVVGVDLQPSQVAKAEALCVSRSVKNAYFEAADVYQLPFPDRSFDAVFAHSVLNHLCEPIQALKEIYRVLRPGGIVGVRDLDWGGRIHSPMTPLLEEWYALTVKIRERNGGNPFMGRLQRGLLVEAGFVRPVSSAFLPGLQEPLSKPAFVPSFLKPSSRALHQRL